MAISGESVRIYSAKLEKDLASKMGSGQSFARISTDLLGNSSGYLSNCIMRGVINRDSLSKICNFYGLYIQNYIAPDEIPQAQPKRPNNFSYDDMIKGMSDIYNLLNKILAENKDLNAKIARQETMLKTITANSTKTAEKTTAIFTEVKYNR